MSKKSAILVVQLCIVLLVVCAFSASKGFALFFGACALLFAQWGKKEDFVTHGPLQISVPDRVQFVRVAASRPRENRRP